MTAPPDPDPTGQGQGLPDAEPGPAQPSASVVICAFSGERWASLVAAIESVQDQSLRPVEIIVVVDHNPALLDRARQAFPDLAVAPSTHRPGASGARNTGGELARGEIVVFLDDDARAEPTWLANLLRPFRDPLVAGVGGQASPHWEGGARPAWFPSEFDWVIGCSYRGLPAAGGPVRNPIGTNMSVRRGLMAAAGGFREDFGNLVAEGSNDPAAPRASTCEETDLCIRVSQKTPGASWIYEPAALVHHRVPPARAAFKYFLSRCRVEGKGKAELARLVGSSPALRSERQYVRTVLTRGAWKGISDTVRERNLDGLSRAGTIVLGLAVTSAFYLLDRGRARAGTGRHTAAAGGGR